MTFYVHKSLAHGPIRFGVTPRVGQDQWDSDPALSTGPAGEFLRRRTTGFFFADTLPIDSPRLPKEESAASSPFLQSLKPVDARGWGYVAMMALGLLLILVGFAVVINKGPQGWIEVILGAILLATPFAVTFRKRQLIRQKEEKERAEREERERRHREMLTAYTTALQELRKNPSDEALQTAERERSRLELPYEIWSPLARRTVLHIGLDALARLSPARAKEAAELVRRAATAVGLQPDDATAVRLDLYRILIWHLLADDRLGDAQAAQLQSFRQGFDIRESDVPLEAEAIEDFHRLRGITKDNLPKVPCSMPLGFREHCIHQAQGSQLDEKLSPREDSTFYITNKRIVLDGKKRVEVPLPQIDDVALDMDDNVLTIHPAKPAKPIRLRLERPIYTAALLDMATAIDERPRSFA